MVWFWEYASPLMTSIDELKRLPTVVVQIAENDVLRDEGEVYPRNMDQGGG